MSSQREALIDLFRRTWGDSLGSAGSAVQPVEVPLAGAAVHLAEIRGELLRWLWSHNQFASFDAAARRELGESVERTLVAMERSHDAVAALAAHRTDLTAFVRARFGETPRDVVCAEYDPTLQLSLLGLYADELEGPVLDLGCGARALLVHTLRAQGLDAHGIDRAVDADIDQTLASTADWLTFDYPRGHFGTILSHHGFTLHFLHHHLAAGDTAYAYARAYMTILQALQPGGRFVYTPGLPFLETMLDASMYRVRRVPFAEELRVASLRQIEAATGLSLSHATHVERLR